MEIITKITTDLRYKYIRGGCHFMIFLNNIDCNLNIFKYVLKYNNNSNLQQLQIN